MERLLVGVLALGTPEEQPEEQPHDDASQPFPGALRFLQPDELTSAARLHVGMLSISMICCLGLGGYLSYQCWREANVLLGHVRNLLIALFFRTFFSLILDAVAILGTNPSNGGVNTLLSFECICLNLVIAFWLVLTVYLHAQVQRKFKSEPSLNLYVYGIPGVALFFAFVWIFVLAAEYQPSFWPSFFFPVSQWIVCTLRLLYLLIQLALTIDMGRMLMKTSNDNDSLSLLRRTMIVMAVLIWVFWIQFGLSLGRLKAQTTSGYQHFDYFMDGSEGVLVGVLLFFLQKWVPPLLSKIPTLPAASEPTANPPDEILVPTSINTLDKFFTVEESSRRKFSTETSDIVYSSVVQPQSLQKTLELYRRLNVLPGGQVTVIEGEEFFDCQTRRSMISDGDEVEFRSVVSDGSKRQPGKKYKPGTVNDHVQKRNAFYASKYLIVEPKDKKSSEKRKEGGNPSESVKGLEQLMADELVTKWLKESVGDDGRVPRSTENSVSITPAQKTPSDSAPNEMACDDKTEKSVLKSKFDEGAETSVPKEVNEVQEKSVLERYFGNITEALFPKDATTNYSKKFEGTDKSFDDVTEKSVLSSQSVPEKHADEVVTIETNKSEEEKSARKSSPESTEKSVPEKHADEVVTSETNKSEEEKSARKSSLESSEKSVPEKHADEVVTSETNKSEEEKSARKSSFESTEKSVPKTKFSSPWEAALKWWIDEIQPDQEEYFDTDEDMPETSERKAKSVPKTYENAEESVPKIHLDEVSEKTVTKRRFDEDVSPLDVKKRFHGEGLTLKESTSEGIVVIRREAGPCEPSMGRKDEGEQGKKVQLEVRVSGRKVEEDAKSSSSSSSSMFEVEHYYEQLREIRMKVEGSRHPFEDRNARG